MELTLKKYTRENRPDIIDRIESNIGASDTFRGNETTLFDMDFKEFIELHGLELDFDIDSFKSHEDREYRCRDFLRLLNAHEQFTVFRTVKTIERVNDNVQRILKENKYGYYS